MNTSYKIFALTLFFLLITHLKFENCCAQWQPDVRLTNDSAFSYTAYNGHSIASNGNTLHVVWFDNRDGDYAIYYKRSTDGGINWSADTRLTDYGSVEPAISVSGLDVYIVWYNYGNTEIYYKRSVNGGINWGTDTRLTYNSAYSYDPSISVTGSFVNIVWVDNRDGNDEIYYERSFNGGINWSGDIRLTNNSQISYFPSVSVSGTDVHVAWYDKLGVSNYEIYYKHSTDWGVTWATNTSLTNDSAESLYPNISVSGLLVHVFWTDNRDGDYEIYYKRSSDGGNSWGVDTRLTNSIGFSSHPSAALYGSNIHIVWGDYRDGNLEVYYKHSTDRGVSWGPDIRLTNDPYSSQRPSIALSGANAHVVWTDNRDGNLEVYYKRSSPALNLNITLSIQGFYNFILDRLNMSDTVKVYLRNSAFPYEIADSQKSVINNITFTGNYIFYAPTGSYYIVLKHRNSLETWSRAGGESLTNGTFSNYDFTTAATQAYGSNMKFFINKYHIFSGDVNQDGIIDGTDTRLIDNDALIYRTGYVVTDITGDSVVDGYDASIADNNAYNFVSTVRP